MIRSLCIVSLALAACCAPGRAQEIVPVRHAHGVGCCATGSCGACGECVRIAEVKKKQTPVYSCKVKEICIPSCNLLGCLFGNKSDCRKIEVRQLVKKYRTEEECVSKCATPEEAAKRLAEAPAKRVAESPRPLPPATVAESVSPRPFLYSDTQTPAASLGTLVPTDSSFTNRSAPSSNPGRPD